MIWGAEKIEKKKFEGPSSGKKISTGLPGKDFFKKASTRKKKSVSDIFFGPPRSLIVEP